MISNLYYSIATQKTRHYGRASHKLYAGALTEKFQSITKVKMHFESSICKSQEHISGETRSRSIAQADSIYEYQSAVKQLAQLRTFTRVQQIRESWESMEIWKSMLLFICIFQCFKRRESNRYYGWTEGHRESSFTWPTKCSCFCGEFMYITTVHCSYNIIIVIQWLGRLTGCNAELSAYKSPLQSCRATIKCREHFKVKLALFM